RPRRLEISTSCRRVLRRIGNSRLCKTLLTKQTTIATSTCAACPIRIVTTVRHGIIDAKLDSSSNDLRFRHVHERRMHVEIYSFRPEARGSLKTFDELRPAIRISTVIERVDADENVIAIEHLRPR